MGFQNRYKYSFLDCYGIMLVLESGKGFSKEINTENSPSSDLILSFKGQIFEVLIIL